MIQTKTYPNGMRLVVETNPDSLLSECMFYFDVGALNEREYEAGYAHMLEHMLAGESSNKHSVKQLNQMFASVGVRPNAFTSLSRTEYIFNSQNQHFEQCFGLYCEHIFDCAFDKDEFEKEKTIILQEHGDSDDNPTFNQMTLNSFFSGQVPLAITGNKKSIEGANLEMLKEFYKREYTPGNLIVSVYGNKTLEEVEKILDKHLFCYIDKNKAIPSPQRAPLSAPDQKKFIASRCNRDQSRVNIVFPYKNEDPALDLLVDAMNDYDGLLYDKLRIEEGLVYNVNTYTYGKTNTVWITFDCNKEDISKCLTKIRNILENVKTNGLTREALTSAIAKEQLSLILSNNNSSFKTENNAELLYENNLLSLEEKIDVIKNVTNDQIKLIAQDVLDSQYLVVAYGTDVKPQPLYAFDPEMASKNKSNSAKSKFEKLKSLFQTPKRQTKIQEKNPETAKNELEK